MSLNYVLLIYKLEFYFFDFWSLNSDSEFHFVKWNFRTFDFILQFWLGPVPKPSNPHHNRPNHPHPNPICPLIFSAPSPTSHLSSPSCKLSCPIDYWPKSTKTLICPNLLPTCPTVLPFNPSHLLLCDAPDRSPHWFCSPTHPCLCLSPHLPNTLPTCPANSTLTHSHH